MRAFDDPDEIGERLEDVVRIAADVVFVSRPIVMSVPDGVDLVNLVCHELCRPLFDLALTVPLQAVHLNSDTLTFEL